MRPVERTIHIENRQRAVRVDDAAARALASFVLACEHVGAPMGVNLRLAGDRELRQLNRAFRGRNGATDVISFPAQAPRCAGPGDALSAGDIAVSADRAVAFARRNGIAADEELARYIVHGILHCLGYEDSSVSDRAAMTARQEELLGQWRASGGSLCRLRAPARRHT